MWLQPDKVSCLKTLINTIISTFQSTQEFTSWVLFSSDDINNDKHEELIIGNAYFISSIYAVKNSKRVFVKGAGMLSVGAMRSNLSIYQDVQSCILLLQEQILIGRHHPIK